MDTRSLHSAPSAMSTGTAGPVTGGESNSVIGSGGTPASAAVANAVGTPEMVPGGALADRMGIEVTEASPERVVATMPVEGNTQPYGMLHGGASAVLAETIGSIGAALHARRRYDGIALGVDLNCTHHRAVRAGTVTGVATALQLGGTVAAYEIVISDEAGRRVCTARLTCTIRQRKPFNFGDATAPDTAAGD